MVDTLKLNMIKDYFKVYVKNISGIETDEIKDGLEVRAYLDENGILKELYTDTIIYRGSSPSEEAFLNGNFGLFAESSKLYERVTEGEALKELMFYPNVVMTERIPIIAKLIELTLNKKNEELGKLGKKYVKKI